ncbi:hypothetical protein ACIQU6_07565 [Streptomyces sp. NPDC090442]|uniref:phage tail tube protein n=1 Tax=Streptomyces sp. NPDC090442 TaxID=3365962 RepID=UPI00380A2FE8
MADEIYNKDAVTVAAVGRIYVAPNETDFSGIDDLKGEDSPWKSLGLFDAETGVEHAFEEETEDIKSWQQGVVRTIVTSRDLTLKFLALETSPRTLELFYGLETGSIKPGADGSFTWKVGASAKRAPFSAVMVLEDGETVISAYLRSAQVSEVEAPTFSAADAIKWGMTIKALGSNYGDAATTCDDGSSLVSWKFEKRVCEPIDPPGPGENVITGNVRESI